MFDSVLNYTPMACVFLIQFEFYSEMFIHLFRNVQNGTCITLSQSAFTCSKLTIKTLEQGVRYVQS